MVSWESCLMDLQGLRADHRHSGSYSTPNAELKDTRLPCSFSHRVGFFVSKVRVLKIEECIHAQHKQGVQQFFSK